MDEGGEGVLKSVRRDGEMNTYLAVQILTTLVCQRLTTLYESERESVTTVVTPRPGNAENLGPTPFRWG